MRGLGHAERAAVGDAARRFVRVYPVHFGERVLEVVGPGTDREQPGRELRRVRRGVGIAVIGDRLDAERRHCAILLRRQLRLHVVVARERVGLEVLHPVLDPLDRFADHDRRGDGDHVARITGTLPPNPPPISGATPANHYFLNSIFANVPRQRHRAGVPALLIHPDDARVRHIAPGDEVRIGNARGSFTAIAEVSDRIRPGTVASTKGYWPQHAKDGATVNATVDARYSDMGHGAVYHDNRVQVKK
jgi:Molydopterin dinucleotide binding domain